MMETLANVVWFEVNGQRYAFAYNHKAARIEIRNRTQSGVAIHSFDNSTPIVDIEAIFANL